MDAASLRSRRHLARFLTGRTAGSNGRSRTLLANHIWTARAQLHLPIESPRSNCLHARMVRLFRSQGSRHCRQIARRLWGKSPKHAEKDIFVKKRSSANIREPCRLPWCSMSCTSRLLFPNASCERFPNFQRPNCFHNPNVLEVLGQWCEANWQSLAQCPKTIRGGSKHQDQR